MPTGWTQVSVGDLADIRSGVGFPKKYQGKEQGEFPFAKVSDISKVFRGGNTKISDAAHYVDSGELPALQATTFPVGTIAFPKIGEALKSNYRVLTQREMLFDNNVMGLIPWQEACDPTYLLTFLRTVDLAPMSVATAVPSVRGSDVAKIEVPFAPLNEQRRIVAKIEALMARSARAKEALDAIPALLDRYRQSVLAAAFRGDLTADWRAQHPDVEPASEMLERIRAERRRKWIKTETERMRLRGRRVDGDAWKAKYVEPTACPPPHGENIPPTWAWASVESLSTKVVDGVHKKPDYVDGGIPFVTVRNLTAGPGINFSELNHISPEDHQEFIKRAHPESGDILISKDGTLGVVRAIRTNIEFSIFVSVAMIKPVDKKITDYLEWALSCPQVQRQMVGVGSGLQHIHLKDLRQDMLPIAPAQEQQVIVSRLKKEMEAIDRLRELVGATKAQFSSLDQAILAKAFRGELVPQDSNDEPASELLARIKAERTATGTPSRRGGRRKRAAAPMA